MKNKVASLINQIRKCAADLEYLAEEEELGFTAGIKEQEEKIAKRIERIAGEFEDMDLDISSLGENASSEEEEVVKEEEEVVEDEVVEDEDEVLSDDGTEDEEKTVKEASQNYVKVACVCTRCNSKEVVAMTNDELGELKSDIETNSGEIFGPECEACDGELIPEE